MDRFLKVRDARSKPFASPEVHRIIARSDRVYEPAEANSFFALLYFSVSAPLAFPSFPRDVIARYETRLISARK